MALEGAQEASSALGDRGLVLNFTKYMLEDGPGIRTVVFLKGCPLRCLWCSSPLGQTNEEDLVYLEYKCNFCRTCVAACPSKALFVDGEGKIGRNFKRCTKCRICVKVCPFGAQELRGTIMTVDEVLEKVEKDRIFYRRGSGGLTLSGGEILMQAKFAANILQRSWDRLIHTAIETCAFGRWEDLRQILTYTNLAFIDIKHFNHLAHKKLTGRSNRQILSNIRQTAAFCLEFKRHLIVRLVVVPGINDDADNLRDVAQFFKDLPGDWELNLLPYHRYGVSKYDWLGMKYKLADVKPPSRDQLQDISRYFESVGIICSVGGAEIRSLVI